MMGGMRIRDQHCGPTVYVGIVESKARVSATTRSVNFGLRTQFALP
jgi:hypothetical protein